MNGEIDLELYTLSIIRLNSAFEKLESSGDDVREMLEESLRNLEKIYKDTVEDLNQDEVNLNEYYLFFQNGKQTFPQYMEVLRNIDNDNLKDIVNSLLNVLNNLIELPQLLRS